jgi:hypothetical protein
MTKRRTLGVVLLVAGIVILLVSALADVVGLGGSATVFGYRQMLGSALGAVIAVVGAVLYWGAARQA